MWAGYSGVDQLLETALHQLADELSAVETVFGQLGEKGIIMVLGHRKVLDEGSEASSF